MCDVLFVAYHCIDDFLGIVEFFKLTIFAPSAVIELRLERRGTAEQ